MKKPNKIILTKDKSPTLFVPELNEHYHSVHGAVQESMHIYIDSGLNYFEKNKISILEIGFGTGLNAVLTFAEAEKRSLKINYETIEKYPVEAEIFQKLDYSSNLELNKSIFNDLHNCKWNEKVEISSFFTIKKINSDLKTYNFTGNYDLVYFDAFSPEKQPKLWTKEIFTKIYNCLNEGGILVTYSAKGIVKQALRGSGFTVKRLPGPPGKHHILRACKWQKPTSTSPFSEI